MDPYVYKDSTVLINKLDIRDEQQLIQVEAQIIIAAILDRHSILDQINFFQPDSLQIVHHFLFNDLYEWAGKFRSIDIYKNETVLNGLSISYSKASEIDNDLDIIYQWMKHIDWSSSNPHLNNHFSKFITDVWRVHPFREGNTRTVSIYMKLFADSQGFSFNAELISENASFFRNSLVLAAVEEAPDSSHLFRIITDALTPAFLTEKNNSAPSKNQYQQIGNYRVTNYEEKPFYTNEDAEL